MTLLEVDEAANAISAEVDPEANIIFGAAFDPSLDGKIRVSVVATGMDGGAMSALEPRSFRSVTAAGRKASAEKAAAPVFEPMADEESVAAAFTAPETESEPALFEAPTAEAPAEPAWMFEAPAAEPAPVVAIQPDLIEADFYEAKIEPLAASSVQDETLSEEPLFPDIDHEDRRPQKGGWLSLFGGGRPRYETPASPAREPAKDFARERPAAAPVAQARTVASAQLAEEPKGDEGEDLNIPSFLRRLAN
jgi:cell division protein FtsZ